MQCGGLAVCVAANGRVSDDWLSIFIVVWLAGGRAGDSASMPGDEGASRLDVRCFVWQQADWRSGWLIDLLVGWLVYWLADWLAGWLVSWLAGWMVG
jgi:hypothetical protein